MTTRSAMSQDTASRVPSAMHGLVTGQNRRCDLQSALWVFERRLHSPANRIRQT